MAISTEIDALLAQAATDEIPLSDVINQLRIRQEEIELPSGSISFSLPTDVDPEDWDDIKTHVNQDDGYSLELAWRKAVNAAQADQQQSFWLHLMRIIQAVKRSNPTLPDF